MPRIRVVVLPTALLATALLALWSAPAFADSDEGIASPIQLAIHEGLQAPGPMTRVYGLRANLVFGESRDVNGLDLAGLAGRTSATQRGIQLGVYNEVGGDLTGVQVGLLSSDVDGTARGLQASVIANRVATGSGTQVALFHNQARSMSGLQISLVNWTDDLEGVQLGLINVNRNGWLPVLPLVNFGRGSDREDPSARP